MKLRTRLIVAFVTVILLPICLSAVLITMIGNHQLNIIKKTYQIENTSFETLINPMRTLSQITVRPYRFSIATASVYRASG